MAGLGDLSPDDQAAMMPETYANPLVSHMAQGLGSIVAGPGQVMQPNPYPRGSEEASWYDDQRAKAVPDWANNTALTMMGGSGVVPSEANSLRMGIKAYHATYEPFEKYDFSKLGNVTRQNTDSEWARNLAQVGPWASDKSIASKVGADYSLPVDIGGKGKSFASLDDLEAAIRDHGGPDQFRQKMLYDGFGHIAVKDGEFGVNSFIGLSPDTFTILKDPFAKANSATAGIGPAQPPMGIRAYHGSPHDFDAFDLSKIGTGEGAQAYGHGLYFADNEGVARSYRDALSTPKAVLDPTRLTDELAGVTGFSPEAVRMARTELEHLGGNAGQTLDLLDGLHANTGYARAKEAAQVIRAMKPEVQNGHMYEVNINADPAHFLDWDKPLSEQPPIVQEMARNADLSHLAPGNRTRRQIEMWREGKLPNPESEPSGNVLHSALTDYGMNSKNNAALTDKFSEAGIPGIKYLDQGSRGFDGKSLAEMDASIAQSKRDIAKETDPGALQYFREELEMLEKNRAAMVQPTSNYVVFNDKLIDIVRKYAIAGVALPPAIAAAYHEMQNQPDHFARGGLLHGQPGMTPSAGLGGLINSPIAGRTDRLPMNAKPNSYVIPADVVSGLGQGNTMAGGRILDAMLKHGPYGSDLGKAPRVHANLPKPPAKASYADGGVTNGVPIITAGGEWLVDPEIVTALGHGDTDKGHEVLDKMVLQIRKQTIKQLKSLPRPVK